MGFESLLEEGEVEGRIGAKLIFTTEVLLLRGLLHVATLILDGGLHEVTFLILVFEDLHVLLLDLASLSFSLGAARSRLGDAGASAFLGSAGGSAGWGSGLSRDSELALDLAEADLGLLSQYVVADDVMYRYGRHHW
jgi:hypothetical protein